MFGLRLNHKTDGQSLEKVERCIRGHFSLESDNIVLVSERRGWLPGFPDLETQILFWRHDPATNVVNRYKLQMFKPAAKINESDLPVGWRLSAFIDDGDPDCC